MNIRFIITFVLLLIMSSVWSVAVAQTPTIFWNPDYSEVAYDSLFTVALEVDENSEALKVYDVCIHFNPDFITLDTVIEGSLLGSSTGLPTFFEYRLSETLDTLCIDGAVLGGTTSADGAGVLAHVWFRSETDSSVYTDLEFVSVDMRDSSDTQMYYSADDGEVRVCLQRGDVNNDHIIDIDDPVYIIKYIFEGGPEPIPHRLVGDVDCVEEVDIDDVVYLIAFIFQGGPPPCTHCYPF